MKCRIAFICLGVASFFAVQHPGFAQGTAFTYQGELLQNSTAVNGSFDLQFKLRPQTNAVTQVGPTLTNAPTAVSNGLFTVVLDFGNVFGTSPLFLEVGVRTNGSTAAYTILSPPQLLTSVPYAVQSLSATFVTGAITDNQLSTNVPLLDGNPVFTGHASFTNATGSFSGAFSGASSGTFSGASSGTFSGTATGIFVGNGGAVTNLNITNLVGVVQSNPNWQLIQATTQQAVAGNNYLTTNAAQTTLILPANSSVQTGTTLQISGSGPNGWILAQNAGQSIITQTLGLPGGQNWTPVLGAATWHALTSSADGMKLAAAIGFGTGQIVYSTNGGASWFTSDAPALNWMALAASADGSRMLAVPNGGNANGDVFTSTNGGANWTGQSGGLTSMEFTCCASSANGINLAAGVGGGVGNIFVSTNGGVSWIRRTGSPVLNWSGIASSADGARLAACAAGSQQIYTSKDEGVTWTNNGPLASWSCIASSADGNKLIAGISAGNGGNLFTSGDGGISWTARATVQTWTCVASSSNGVDLAAAYGGGTGFLMTSSDSGATWVTRTNGIGTIAQNWSALASSATGSRLVAAVDNGQIFTSIASTTAGPAGFLTGNQYSVLGLQYVGNGQWIPLTFVGGFTAN